MADDEAGNLERELTCSVCMELYDDPLELPCLHSFCKACLQVILASQGGVHFRCPDCREKVTLGPAKMESLKRNFKLASIVEAFDKFHQKSLPPPSDTEEETQEQPAALGEPLRMRLKPRKYSASRNARRRERRRYGGGDQQARWEQMPTPALSSSHPAEPTYLILPPSGYLQSTRSDVPHLCVHPMVPFTPTHSPSQAGALSRRGDHVDVIVPQCACQDFFVHPVAGYGERCGCRGNNGLRADEVPQAERPNEEFSFFMRCLILLMRMVLSTIFFLLDFSSRLQGRRGRF